MNMHKGRRIIYKKILSILMIIIILAPTLMTSVSKAEQRPDTIRVVTDEAEKEVLLGTTSEKARAENILGLAGKFSLFTKGNITLTGADAEGKIASGGTITSTTSYQYEAGTEVTGETEAKIIAQNGLSGGFDLTSTKHTTRTNNSWDSTKKIAAIGTNANNMNWNGFYSSSNVQNQIVASDLIDFNDEFIYLQNQSNYLSGLEANGTITKCYGFGDSNTSIRGATKAVVFSGNNKKLNVFSMNTSEFNNLFNSYPNELTRWEGNNENILQIGTMEETNIFFDVPKGSHIIININGEAGVNFSTEQTGTTNPGNSTKYRSVIRDKANIYFLADKEDIAKLERSEYSSRATNTVAIEYAFNGKDFLRYENGDVKAFKCVFGAGSSNLFSDDALEYSKYILYNMPQAKSFQITNSMYGSILAPRASGTDNSYGYVYGQIACNSYSGGIQFSNISNTIELDSEFDVKIKKIDSETNKNISNVKMQITDLDGNVIKEWTTNENESIVSLKNGEYILKEIESADNYNSPKEIFTYFTINGNKYNNSNYYKIEMGAKRKNINLEEHSYASNPYYRTIDDIYRNTGILSTNIGQSIIQELEFNVTHYDENIDYNDLYYVVASSGHGIDFHISGNTIPFKPTDWVEFKKWTKVSDGINVRIPIVSVVYDNHGNGTNEAYGGMKVHFYTSDGVEVTDKVSISPMIMKWYTINEQTTTYTNTTDNVFLNDEEDTLIVTNDHIKTTVEITKQDRDSSATLLQGAIYEIQDSEGNVVKDLEGNNLTFEATNTDGKSTLENLRLDVGTYYLVEVQAPAGYKLSQEKVPFTVKPHTSETITKTVKDEKIKVNVEKQDEYGNALAGANLQILDKNKKVVKTWTSKNIVEEIEGLSPGEYTLHENYAPTGFVKADDIQFTVTDQGKVTIEEKEVEKIVMTNKNLKGTISITKRGETLEEVSRLDKLEKYKVYQFVWKENPLENVIYDLYAKNDILVNGTKVYSKDEKITAISTGFDGVANYSGLVAGDYYVIEKSAPNQYEIDNEKHDISLIVTYDENNNQKLIATTGFVNERKKETIELTKTEKGSNNAVEGAIYGLYNQEAIGSIAENTLLDVVMTDELGKGKFEADLPVGNYYVKEIEAPNGYLLSEESKYINFNESTDFKINVEDDFIKVNILKIDKNGNALPGAKLQITDKKGNIIVPEWTSEEKAKEISKILNVGETYILKEIEAPSGYAKSVDKNFVVLNTAEVQEINFINYTTKVNIAKQSNDGKILEGAELKLVEIETGEEIETWTTGNTKHEINGKLKAGNKYKIIETKAPDGYVTAEPKEFTVEDTDIPQEIVMTDNETKIAINKQDEDGNALAGAKLQLLDENGNPIEEWTSTEKPYEINGKLVVGKTYTIKEIEAPKGFVIGEDKLFTVEDKNEVQSIYVENKSIKVIVNKLDENDSNLAGATLQILDENKEIIDTWESTTSGHTVDNKLIMNKKYTLKELKSPAGYSVAEDMEFTVDDLGSVKTINMKDSRLQISVQKVNEDQELIEGAELQITDLNGKVLESWESKKEPYNVEAKLAIGETYILKELKPADGYVTAKDKLFTVTNSKDVQLVELVDEKTKLTFAKYDEDGNLVPGATFQIVDEKGNIVEEWTTGNTEHDIVGKLVVGKTYILKEVNTPEGYVTAEDMTFTVDDTGDLQQVGIKEQTTKVQISKQDITTGKELPGAKLTVTKEDGTVVETWISKEDPHYIEGKLVAGETYILTEETAPNGYVTTEKITFTVENTGEIQKVTMKDDTNKVSILKVDENGKAVIGATLQLKDEEENIIKEWISKESAEEFIGKLAVGKTYTIKETKAPDGYATAAEKTFTVKDTPELQEIQMTNNTTKVSISKQDITTGEEIVGAELTLETIDGEIIDKWISTNKPHEINGTLIAGESYILTEETAPDGYIKAEKVIFKVEDTEEIQKVEMRDDYTKVKIEKVDENEEYLKGAELQIINEKGNVVEKWTTDNNPYEINKKLISGGTYTLQEITAPNGYKKAEDITFKVSENGEIDTIKIVNIKEETKVSEVTKNIIQGALPKTGDVVIIYIAIVAVALGVIVFIIIRKKSTKKENSINQKK